MAEVTSAQVAAKASAIMSLAKQGGPIKALADQVREIVSCAAHDKNKVDRLDALLRPYIDNAESIAASALTQREKKTKK